MSIHNIIREAASGAMARRVDAASRAEFTVAGHQAREP